MHVWNLLSGGNRELRGGGERVCQKGGDSTRSGLYTLVVTDSALYVLMLSDPLCKTTLYGLRPPLYGSTDTYTRILQALLKSEMPER